MKMPDIIRHMEPSNGKVTTEEHIQSWTKQKEFISAKPTGPTFSEYKIGSEATSVAEVDALIRSLPQQFGFSPIKWQNITDVEILKKAGVYDISKMRTIQLMHAEFNMNNKVLGKTSMERAEKAGTIEREQFGGQHGQSSIIAALNKRLTMDLPNKDEKKTSSVK